MRKVNASSMRTSMKRRAPYKVYVLASDGSRSPFAARRLVVELRPGIEVEIELDPHPNHAGHLILSTPATSRMEAEYRSGNIDDFSVIFGATNVLHVLVKRRRNRPQPSAKAGVGSRRRTKHA